MALVELLGTGEARRRQAQAEAVDLILELGWAQRAGRRDVLALNPGRRAEIELTLDRAWPAWRTVVTRLTAAGLPLTPVGLRELARRDRLAVVDAGELPDRINRRTAAATVARHAKAHLGPLERAALEAVDLTADGIVRMRPHAGLLLERDGVRHDAHQLATLLGELVISDRALRDGTRLAGRPPRGVLTVENLGAFQDAVVPADVLVMYVPGWNTRLARDVLAGLEAVPILHFGDLDPNGVAILEHLRRWRSDVGWWVPGFWADYLGRGLTKRWPDIVLPADAPSWVHVLPERGIWLEQEVILVDPRFAGALSAAFDG